MEVFGSGTAWTSRENAFPPGCTSSAPVQPATVSTGDARSIEDLDELILMSPPSLILTLVLHSPYTLRIKFGICKPRVQPAWLKIMRVLSDDGGPGGKFLMDRFVLEGTPYDDLRVTQQGDLPFQIELALG
jgi:hypothetical protein